MKRKITILFLLILPQLSAIACPVCERNQPRVLKGITHGAGPGSSWDYVIVWVAVFIVLGTLLLSVRWLIKPGETADTHIKRSILNNS